MSVKAPRRSSKPLGEDFAKATSRMIQDRLGIKVDFARLDAAEGHELFALCRKINVEERAPGPPAAEVDAFVSRAIAAGEERSDPLWKANAALLAERARETHRVPSSAEVDRIVANTDPAATLQSLRLPPPPSDVTARGIDMNRLDERQRARFELLVEKGAGREPGAIFEARREKERFSAHVRELAAQVAPGPRRRRRVDAPGLVVLPREFYQGMLAGDATRLGLTTVDLVVFAFVLYALENRQLPGYLTKNRLARFDGRNQDTLLVRVGQLAFGHANLDVDQAELISRKQYEQALNALDSSGWLRVEGGAPGGDGWVRISRGPKLEKFLAAREEL